MGWVDLHCHYLPDIDDGVKTFEAGVELCQKLAAIGYERVVATPHIRTAYYENRKPGLEKRFNEFKEFSSNQPGMPQLGLATEHFFDDVFWGLWLENQVVPYPGGKALLVEFPNENFPRQSENRFFEMQLKGIKPVLAHPERYTPLFKRTDPIDPLLEVGALPQLDLMSLVGKYGRQPKKAAERMLKEETYFIASSDCHRPEHVDILEKAIKRLFDLVEKEYADRLLSENPRTLLEG